ncbi:hypothetical protein KPL70_007569 [Citrus sinensis]|nr:hypothetical protein KPL70_007569 [Citrus sinensis]
MAVATATFLVLQPSFSSPFAVTPSSKLTFPNYSSPRRRIGLSTVACTYVALSSKGQGAFDPELRSVLELATDSELYELERILFGPSYFSPLLKSFTKRADVDYVMIEQDLEEREDFIASLESRFLFLAADARSTLRGWRPSYRNVLLAVRKNLNIPCSSKLSTEDLEAEIFLHLLQEYARDRFNPTRGLRQGNILSPFLFILVVDGLSKLMGKALEANIVKGIEVGQEDNGCAKRLTFRGSFPVLITLFFWRIPMFVSLCKGNESRLSCSPIHGQLMHVFDITEESGVFPGSWENSEASDAQNSLELGLSQWKVQALAAFNAGAVELKSMMLKGGQLAAINLESRAALLAAKQGFAGAATKYLGLRNMVALLGPVY